MLWDVERNVHRKRRRHTLTVYTTAQPNRHIAIVNPKVYFNTHYLVTQERAVALSFV